MRKKERERERQGDRASVRERGLKWRVRVHFCVRKEREREGDS